MPEGEKEKSWVEVMGATYRTHQKIKEMSGNS